MTAAFAFLQDLDCEDYIRACMKECWREDPMQRPGANVTKLFSSSYLLLETSNLKLYF